MSQWLKRYGEKLYKETYWGTIKRDFLNLLEGEVAESLLDLGCDDGSFTTKLADIVGVNEVYAIELIKERANLAVHRGIKCKVADLNKPFPFPDGMFDLITANQIIEHLYEIDIFGKEISRVLRSGGHLVISTPNLASFHNIFALLLGMQPPTTAISNEFSLGCLFNPPFKKETPIPGHVRVFAYDGLLQFLEYHGFKIERLVTSGYYPFPEPLSRLLSKIDKRHAAYLTVKARKR